MKLAALYCGTLCIILGACTSNPSRTEAPTIGSLGKRPVIIEDIPVDASESETIEAYRKFLASGDDSETRPQAMRRLADLELEADDLLPEAEMGTPAPNPMRPQQINDSIRLYREVLAQYPDRPDNDSVLYQLARAYEHNAQPLESLATLGQLTQRFPNSSYIVEAQFRRGEILFVQKRYQEAEQAYQQVVSASDTTPFYRQSLYKLGWCYFKQSLYTEGLDSFMALLDLSLDSSEPGKAQLEQLDRTERELIEDTLRVITLSLSYESGAEGIHGYFSDGERHYADLVYERLGSLYLSKERYTDAALTFQSFTDNYPGHAKAPVFQMRVIETYKAGKFPTQVLEGKKQYVERYKPGTDYWQHHGREDNEEVIVYLKASLTDLSRHYHALAQRTKKNADYQQAIYWYRTHLDSFPESGEAPGVNFLLAELLYESSDYLQATREYTNTAYKYGDHDKAADAGYASVLSSIKVEEKLSGDDQQQWHLQSIENALLFSMTFPEHPQAIAVQTKTAEALLADEDYKRAAQLAQTVTENEKATDDQQLVAWTVLAHARFDLAEYAQAELAYQQVRSRLPADSKEKVTVKERLAASIYKQGEKEQAAGNTTVAVAHFQRVSQITPDASIAATASYDAAAGLMSTEDWSAAADELKRFRSNYPDDPRQPEVTRRLATAYLGEKQPTQAAIEFERIGRESSDQELRREALLQSAELYAEAGQSSQSAAVYRYFIEQFPTPVEPAVEVRQKLAQHYKSIGDTGRYEKWLGYLIKADRKAGDERTDRTRYLAARAQFTLSDAAYQRYMDARLDLPLKKSLAHKKLLMEKTLKLNEQAADYQVAEITSAAAYRTAEIYANMGEALMNSQRPAKLSGEALEQYDILLEDQAYPFEEQAITLHETNVERMASGTYNAWIEKSLHQLAILVPSRYAKREKSTPYVAAIH